MSPAEVEAPRKGLTKEKKQLFVLGGLCSLLLLVIAVPREGGEAPTQPPSAATATAPAPAAPAPAPTPARGSSAEDRTGANAALSAAPKAAEESRGLLRSPFESFWALTKPVDTRVDDIPPPAVVLNGTLTSGRTPAAVIDGQTRFLGDVIQGWTLEEIGSREILLRSPAKNVATIRMPLLRPVTFRPDAAGSP